MTPAVYNPAALDRIRKGACAADLGWDDSTYRSRCQRHGLVPVSSPSSATPATALFEQTVEQPPIADGFDPLTDRPVHRNPLTFDPDAGTLARNRTTVPLTPLQCTLLAAFARHRPPNPTPGAEIAVAAGWHRTLVRNYLGPLRKVLRRLHVDIDAHMGPGGGYVLVDNINGEPVGIRTRESQP